MRPITSSRRRPWPHPRFDLACERIAAELPPSKARNLAPAIAVLARYGQKKASLEEAILELYHGSISIATIDRLGRSHWAAEDWSRCVSSRAAEIRREILHSLSRPITRPPACVLFQGVSYRQKALSGSFTNFVMAAIGVSATGQWEILSVMSAPEDQAQWELLIDGLKQRGLAGTTFFVGENDADACAAVRTHFPKAIYQGCLEHLENEMMHQVPAAHQDLARATFAAMRTSQSRREAIALAEKLAHRLRRWGAPDAAAMLAGAAEFQLKDHFSPRSQRRWTEDAVLLRKRMLNVRERVRIIGPVNHDEGMVLLVAARLRYAAAALQRTRGDDR